MAVPKRFRFKSKKKKFSSINNNSKFICPLANQYFLNDTKFKAKKNKEKKLLFWLKFFSSLTIVTIIFLNFNLKNFMSLLLVSEFVLILIFYTFVFNALIHNLNWIFGFSFIIIILGGLEIALSFLLLNL